MKHTAAALALLLSLTSVAKADNPFDALQSQRASRIARSANSASGAADIAELFGDWDAATPGSTLAQMRSLYENRRLSPERRALAGFYLAQLESSAGNEEASDAIIAELGYVTDWRVVGPFDNEGKRGFATPYGPELNLTGPTDLSATWPGKERAVSWRTYPDAALWGYIGLGVVLRPTANACAYQETTIVSERAQALRVYLGGSGAVKAWWNGAPVTSDDVYRTGSHPDRVGALVGAHRGPNRLLIKACSTDGAWGTYVRVTDGRGRTARGISVDAAAAHPITEGEASTRGGSAPTTEMSRVEAAAAGESPSAESLESLARFLALTNADDPNERRARDLAHRAVEMEPTMRRLDLALQFARDRGEQQRFAREAEEHFADNPKSLMLRARVQAMGMDPGSALPILDRIPDGSVTSMYRDGLRISILQQVGLTRTAAELSRRLSAQAEGSPRYIMSLIDTELSLGHVDRVMELYGEWLEADQDNSTARRRLIGDALIRRDTETVDRHLNRLLELETDSTRTMLYAASIYEGLGRTERANAQFTRALAIAPEDADVLVAQGRFFMRQRRPQDAERSFREAIALRPQDRNTRELLEQLEPEQERPDERYAFSPEQLLARRVEGDPGYPVTVLERMTVNTVFENGLGSSFHQFAAQVHNDDGARASRTFPIQYAPGSQRVDVQQAKVYRADGSVLEANDLFERSLGEPWYRIYYDTRAVIVVFPDLEPGDVIELRYRVDDISHRNLFADYYGDLQILQSGTPTKRLDYMLLTPTSREFHFNTPALDSLQHTRTEEDGQRRDHYFVENIPAITPEFLMPGRTEIAPYLHVSTYATWEGVGRWYWGLIQDQLIPDDDLRNTVAELVADKTTTQEKVVAIHNWVIKNTRYVGLEFGIHGYLPYRVTQTVQRGFGDCKDKASLLFSMMREAGIPAHIILVRTRRNGAIRDLPASLAVFDHAIAYVPELDLYLDGTAEHSGSQELPLMDQGVTVLHVWPDGSELRRSPIHPAARNRRERRLRVRLAADGTAALEGEERVVGAEASSYRHRYQAEGTRDERFEAAMRDIFPGFELETESFEGIDELESEIRFTYAGSLRQLGQRDGGRLRVPATVMHDLVQSLARSPGRRLPLDLGSTTQYAEDRTIEIPQGKRFTETPQGGEANSEFGRFQMRVTAEGQTLVVHTEFELTRDRLQASEYEAFRAWVEQVDLVLRQRIGVE